MKLTDFLPALGFLGACLIAGGIWGIDAVGFVIMATLAVIVVIVIVWPSICFPDIEK